MDELARLSTKVDHYIKEMSLIKSDPQVAEIIKNEEIRQQETLNLIASENIAGASVLEAAGSLLTNKYAEGYPSGRYYGGCEYIDKIEELAISRAKRLFKADYVNVQPHSGTQANMAIYFAVLSPGDRILGMDLAHGGHLTHGATINFSGTFYRSSYYGVEKKTGLINLDDLEKLAKRIRPKLIICGASSYPRKIDFLGFRRIADSIGAWLLADIAHIAGLIAVGLHPSPVGIGQFVTTTTHKTLRGPRGGMIIAEKKFGKTIDRMVFPGIQGGPLMHIIAAKAVALGEALKPEFKRYQSRIIKNSKKLAEELKKRDFRPVTGGTDNHLILIDLTNKNISGSQAEKILERVGIVVNKNLIPFDQKHPTTTSGIRLGTPTVTSRGMKEAEMVQIAAWIEKAINNRKNKKIISKIRKEIKEFCYEFPIYKKK